MKRMIRAAALLVCGFLLSNSAFAAPGNLRLMPGFPVSNSLSLGGSNPSRSFRVVIPEDAFEVRFFLSDSPADLDLYLYSDSGEVFFFAEESLHNEEIILSRLGRPALYGGQFELEVLYQLSRPPVIDGRVAESIPFTLTMEVTRLPESIALEPDRSYERILRPGSGGIDMFTVDLPRDAQNFRIDIFNTESDIDFALNPGEPVTDPYDALFSGSSFLANEHAVYDISDMDERRFHLMVLPGVFEEREVPYSIRVSADPEPPSFLFPIPDLPRASDGMARNILATVELATDSGGGSGCIISPRGHILTNHHVVVDEGGEISETIAVGITFDERRPSRELFLAEVLFYDEERDIALMVISSGLYGQRIPDNLRFSYFEFADVDELELGDELIFLGYPNVGGLGSKATITLTRGVVSGFEDLGLGLTIKTDGEINYGNSGGAALTSDNRLIGMPTQLNPDSGGKLAYIHSIDMIPRAWLETLGLSAP